MGPERPVPAAAGGGDPSTVRTAAELFLLSLLLLFLELACIRWFAAHVPFLTFFTNTVLLACFFGMALGCLAASRPRRYLNGTPLLLALALATPQVVYYLEDRFQMAVDVDNARAAADVVFFGTEYPRLDFARFVVPIEVLAGCFFVLLALTFVGLGQELGRGFGRLPNRVAAYSVNVLGSLAGIVLFFGCSWAELSPVWWFLLVGLGLGYLVFQGPWTSGGRFWRCLSALPLVAVLGLADWRATLPREPTRTAAAYVRPTIPAWSEQGLRPGNALPCSWSPYYRIDYEPASRGIYVNLIVHQHLVSRDTPYPAYALPHLLNRDAGGVPFQDVLIIGAGSGNDVSWALQWGARQVEAVDIDPVILRLGRQHHPDEPYQDERVAQHLDDGRNFLRTADRRYDLIVYALVDSLVLHSGSSSLRLESYLFSREAFADVRRRLKPGGLFVLYNNYRQGWLVARLRQTLLETFESEPLVLTLPHREMIEPEERWDGFTVLLAGDTERLRQAFDRHTAYWLRRDRPPGPDSPDGFAQRPPADDQDRWQQFALSRVIPPESELEPVTDDWPFLYLRRRLLPPLSLRGLAVLASLSLLLLVFFLPARTAGARRGYGLARLFFLGAGFLLVETKAVVHLALVFGSTWVVNAVVFGAVLVTILGANVLVLGWRPARQAPWWFGLLATLALSALVPLQVLLGLPRGLQVVCSGLLVFTPILFAGVAFAMSFGRCDAPDQALAANTVGALVGGLTEYGAVLLGFQSLTWVALAYYVLAAVCVPRATSLRERQKGELPSLALPEAI